MYGARNIAVKPAWADTKIMLQIYKTAKKLRKMGHAVEVDHIVPITSKLVCGLHCEDNLRIVNRELNRHKSNHHWPDMPNEQLRLRFVK